MNLKHSCCSKKELFRLAVLPPAQAAAGLSMSASMLICCARVQILRDGTSGPMSRVAQRQLADLVGLLLPPQNLNQLLDLRQLPQNRRLPASLVVLRIRSCPRLTPNGRLIPSSSSSSLSHCWVCFGTAPNPSLNADEP